MAVEHPRSCEVREHLIARESMKTNAFRLMVLVGVYRALQLYSDELPQIYMPDGQLMSKAPPAGKRLHTGCPR